jgi:hypothetical protein
MGRRSRQSEARSACSGIHLRPLSGTRIGCFETIEGEFARPVLAG